MQCANDKRTGCMTVSRPTCSLSFRVRAVAPSCLNPCNLLTPNSLNFSTKDAEVSVTPLPCARSFPMARATIEHGASFSGTVSPTSTLYATSVAIFPIHTLPRLRPQLRHFTYKQYKYIFADTNNPFVPSLNTAFSSQRKPASVEISRESYRAPVHDIKVHSVH
jgi:hypothetical protein